MKYQHVLTLAAALALPAAAPASAQMSAGPASAGYKIEAGTSASAVPSTLREVGFDQNLDQQVPLDIAFRDESGRTVRLGDYIGTKPVVLALVYFDCPMLCTQVLNGLVSSLETLKMNVGREFNVVTVSFDPREKPALAAAKKATYLERYGRPGAESGWHFLTGDQPSIDRLTKAVGFRYVWDAQLKQFAHPTGIMVLTPQGRIARYLFGIEYWPRDLNFALIDATQGRIGSPVEQVLLYCYHYDPSTGRYGLAIVRTLRIAGAATVLLLGGFILIMIRKERS
ncbi:MAG: SCO family protein [Betaproteobacteria bacterium]